MDTPSASTVQRFRIRVGLGKKKPQRQVSLRRNTSTAHRGPDGASRAQQTPAGGERGTGQHRRTASRGGVSGSRVDKQLTASDIAVVPVSRASHPRPSAVVIEHSGQPHEQNGRRSRVSQEPEPSSHQSSSDQSGSKTKKSKGLLGMISTRLRAQTPTEDHATAPAAEQLPRKSSANRKSVSVARRNTRSGPPLENDFTSKVRREEALRARGLLPPKPVKDLSEMEAELDARRAPVAPPDSGGSQAKEIVEMWRKSNMFTLEEEPTSTEPSDAQDAPTTSGQDILVTERPPSASPLSANSKYFTPMNSPMNISQVVQSGSVAPRSPALSSRTSLRNRPLGPRPTSPTNSRKSHSRHPSGSSFDHQFTYPTSSTASSHPTASQAVDGANVAPSQPEVKASAPVATPIPPSPRRRGTAGSATSTRSDIPGRKSISSHHSQPQSPKAPGSPTSPRPPQSPRSPRSRSSTYSSHTHPAATPAPSGPLPPTPTSPTTRHVVLEPAPKTRGPRSPAPKRTASGTSEPSSSEKATTNMPASPTLPSLIESTSSHMSTATSSSSAPTPPAHGGFDRIGPNSKSMPPKGSRAPINPIIVESTEEDFLRNEIVIDPDAYLDREFGVRKDITPFTLPAAVPRLSHPTPINDDRRKSLGFFGKKRSNTTDGGPELAKPLSLSNLRRTVTGALRPRPVSQAYASSPRASPVPPVPVSPLASAWTKDSTRLDVPDASGMRRSVSPRMHSPGSILLQTKGIEDDESRRLSELAFLD